jgi:hypothetical protein
VGPRLAGLRHLRHPLILDCHKIFVRPDFGAELVCNVLLASHQMSTRRDVDVREDALLDRTVMKNIEVVSVKMCKVSTSASLDTAQRT